MKLISCPLCLGSGESIFCTPEKYHGKIKLKNYSRCPCCGLIFLSKEDHLNSDIEKSRYESHRNDISDWRYRNFLEKLWQPLKKYISKSEQGLDVGSGKEAALCSLAGEQGYSLSAYDPLFGPKKIEQETYNYITCTEVIEHFCNPLEEWKKLKKLLVQEGYLAVMTEFYKESNVNEINSTFKSWAYRRDETHVSFYTKRTMDWIAHNLSFQILEFNDRLCIFKNS